MAAPPPAPLAGPSPALLLLLLAARLPGHAAGEPAHLLPSAEALEASAAEASSSAAASGQDAGLAGSASSASSPFSFAGARGGGGGGRVGVSESDEMSGELQGLERKLQKKVALHGGGDFGTEEANKLAQLMVMLRNAKADELTGTDPGDQAHELKAQIRSEIGRLSGRIDRLDVGHLEYEVPASAARAPGRGHVRVDLSPHSEGRPPQGKRYAMTAPGYQTLDRVQEKGIDVDTEMPFGELEPFGREDTAQELTEASVRESDEMVDQLERAEVAEEKRAVFRALTRLRGAAITSFDGVARSQTGNIDGYSKVHKFRLTHPLHHLADEESDISKWAFPDTADF